MREYLPPIDFAVTAPLEAIIADMAVIAEKSKRFTVERHYDVWGEQGFHIVNLRFEGSTQHEDLGAQLICRNDLKNRVAVEVRARRWEPDPPTRAAYCQAAKDLVCPLLRAYNAANQTRYRLRIASRKSLTPKLPPASLERFTRFVVCANKSSLHPLDWKRFYEFVWKSRSRMLHEDDMVRLLIDHGFSEPQAERIASIYVHLCEFKGCR